MKHPENTAELIEENRRLKGRISELESLKEGYTREKDLLLSIFEATSPLTGEAFMRSLTKELATVLKVRYALIGEVIDDRKKVITLALWANGEFVPNIVYGLAGTPCDNVVNQVMRYYPCDIRKLFPEDRFLVEMDVESYIGVPLFDPGGNALGVMAALHDGPIEDAEKAKTLFKFFAVRAGVELQRMRSEEALRKSEASLANAQRMANLGNWDWDIAKNELSWSDEIYRIFGVAPRKFGATFDAFLGYVHPEDRKFVRWSVDEALGSRKPYSIDHRILLPDNTVKVVHEQGEVAFDEAGKPVRMNGTVQDVTGLKRAEEELRKYKERLEDLVEERTAELKDVNLRLEREISDRKKALEKLLESEQKYRGLYESTRDGIARTDMEGNFLDCNQALLDMLGYTKDEMLKLSYKQITPAKWLEVSAEKIKNHVMARGYSDLYEKEYIRKDGTVCPISIRAWLKRDAEGNPFEMWGIVRDITDLKKAGEDIKKLNLELKDNIAKLEEANGELEAFNYSLAHDLSSPLRVIDGFSKMIEKHYSEKLDEEGKEFIKTVRGSAQKMGELISALLHLSRLGKSEIRKAAVDMAGTARSLSEELKAASPGRDIEFRIKELPSAFGEPTLIRQAFFNLMTNAVKFTKPREKPVIEVGGSDAENENVYYVKDNGIGFDMKYARQVFGVFKRLHTEKEFEGTGVGLAIVQRIVQRHGGRVRAEGAVDHGATFYFSLPKG